MLFGDVDNATPDHLFLRGKGKGLELYIGDREVQIPDVVINRSLTSDFQNSSVLRSLERRGVLVLNSTESVARSGDKWAEGDALRGAGIRTPDTVVIRRPRDLYVAEDELNVPFILKPRWSSGGKNIYTIRTHADIQTVGAPLCEKPMNWIAQELIKYYDAPPGHAKDARGLVVGDRVVAVCERIGRENESAANVQGAETWLPPDSLSTADQQTLVNSAKTVGLEWCSVDFWQTDDGLVVNETSHLPELALPQARLFAEHVLGRISQLWIDRKDLGIHPDQMPLW
jgi:RimK family alpha-L-glutamate ligase